MSQGVHGASKWKPQRKYWLRQGSVKSAVTMVKWHVGLYQLFSVVSQSVEPKDNEDTVSDGIVLCHKVAVDLKMFSIPLMYLVN